MSNTENKEQHLSLEKNEIHLSSQKNANRPVNSNTVISLVLSFVLSVLILVLSGTLIINRFVLSETGLTGSLSAANYHEGVYQLIRDNVGDTLLPTQLPYSIIDDAITSDAIYADLNEYISYMFAGNLSNLYQDRDAIVETINYNIDYFLDGRGLTQTEVGYEIIAEVVDSIIASYNHYINTPFLSYITRINGLFSDHFRQLILIGVIGMLITSGIIYLVSRRFKHLTLRYYAISFGAAALMLIAAPLALRIWGVHHRLAIGPEFVYDFVVTHIERSITTFLQVGALFVALYLIFIIISTVLQKKTVQA
jgi:hypothetical protein